MHTEDSGQRAVSQKHEGSRSLKGDEVHNSTSGRVNGDVGEKNIQKTRVVSALDKRTIQDARSSSDVACRIYVRSGLDTSKQNRRSTESLNFCTQLCTSTIPPSWERNRTQPGFRGGMAAAPLADSTPAAK